jgi:peptidoglycan hydrolase-like protein with peptidoglycan-binding domain
METFAYLHAAQEYEYPEKKEINLRWLNPAALALLGMTCVTLAVNLASAAQATTVFRGDSGTNVTRLQDLLRNAGYFPAATTGFFGDFTEAAVQDFQQSRGLAVDGIAGYETLEALESSVSPGKSTVPGNPSDSTDIAFKNSFNPKFNSDNCLALVCVNNPAFSAYGTVNNQPASNADADRVSRLLKQAGYLQKTPPGSIEVEDPDDVRGAVERFQQANGLPVTGFADQVTVIALENAPAV